MSALDATMQRSEDRPYRSHLRPACLACRRRKSRCKMGVDRLSCLMCETHGTACDFPPGKQHQRPTLWRQRRAAEQPQAVQPLSLPLPSLDHPLPGGNRSQSLSAGSTGSPADGPFGDSEQLRDARDARGRTADVGPFSQVLSDTLEPLANPGLSDLAAAACQVQGDMAVADDDNTHIVGPVETSDTRVLADYLSAEPSTSWQSVRARTDNAKKPVLFTSVRKRPLGSALAQSVASQKCQIVEKMLEPWLDELTHLYFSKVNCCFPLLDPVSFMQLYRHDRKSISPALLAVLYASTMVFWKSSPVLVTQKCPDIRFIWNQANEALYSEMYLSPGIATIITILLNVGGRPTTSIIGNAAQLGCAVSFAHSLGLNRDPTNWDIPPQEKLFRMRIWWALVVQDKWCSLAYGTPSHIRRSQYDVPQPRLDHLWQAGMTYEDRTRIAIFVSLVTLSELLGTYLEYVYDLHTTPGSLAGIPPQLEASLSHWEESLDDDVRRIILRGTNLHHLGAANLRLSYLAVKLLHRRIELDFEKHAPGPLGSSSGSSGNSPGSLSAGHLRVRKAAEDVVFLAQELGAAQLVDFWLSTSAFVFTSAMTVLLRCALEAESAASSLAQSPSMALARDLIDSLRAHREKMDWDLADICLAQYTGVMGRLLATAGKNQLTAISQVRQLITPDVPDIDELFPSLWDMFDSA